MNVFILEVYKHIWLTAIFVDKFRLINWLIKLQDDKLMYNVHDCYIKEYAKSHTHSLPAYKLSEYETVYVQYQFFLYKQSMLTWVQHYNYLVNEIYFCK